jgi:hypothetical protein
MTNEREDKHPWTKWYWQDWLADTGLKASSLAAKGLWVEMLAIMARSEKRGYLLINGKQIKSKLLAKLFGENEEEIKRLLNELEENGVYSIDSTGVIYCRRMAREAKISNIRSEVGKLGGRPKKQKETKTKAKRKQNPASASVYASEYSLKEGFSDWFPKDEFEAFIEMRKENKTSMTKRAIELAIKKLAKLKDEGHDPKEVLEQSIFRSWQGLFPLRDDSKNIKSKRDLHIEEQRKRFLKDEQHT